MLNFNYCRLEYNAIFFVKGEKQRNIQRAWVDAVEDRTHTVVWLIKASENRQLWRSVSGDVVVYDKYKDKY